MGPMYIETPYITQIRSFNASITSVLNYVFTFYQKMPGKHHFLQNLLELENLTMDFFFFQ